MTLQLNPLSRYSTFNYIWFMDVAPRNEIRTSAYKNRRGRILRSGGISGTGGESLQTSDESRLGVKGEYFIDNVSTQAYISPNPYSGLANVTKVEFEVVEPYSIGMFLETLQIAAEQAGYRNYLDAPFTLGVEFTGFDSNGNSSTIQKRVMLIKIVKATFNITEAGSTYRVQAIPWNHQALLDEANKISVNFSIKGDTVEEILTSDSDEGLDIVEQDGTITDASGTRSLIKALTGSEKDDIKAKGGDRDITANEYEILFPVDPAQLGTKNDFARYKIAENFADIGNQDIGIPDLVYDEENSLYVRGNLSISENGRVYQFRAGTKIEKIIEEVILTSEWSKDIMEKKPDSDGYVEWFKILTFVDILPGDKDRFGSLPKKYTYIVYPYKLHQSVLKPVAEDNNYNSSVRNAIRGYSYIYTGHNSEIIDFSIDIDYAWIQAVANLSQTSQALRNRSDALLIRQEAQSLVDLGVDRGLAEAEARNRVKSNMSATNTTFSNYGGANRDSETTRVARAFNDAIVNSNADLVKLKMTIWGDPYFLADTDFGGYIANRGRMNVNADGGMEHLRSEVDVLVNFSSAVDYKNDLLSPNNARQFSGVYKLIRVNSYFEAGTFKQELEMIRRRNQDSASIDNAIAALNSLTTGNDPFIRPPNSRVTAGDLNYFFKQASETEQLFNIFGQLNFQELISSLDLTPFGLVSQLNNFNELFDQAKQIKSSIANLSNLSNSASLQNINAQSLQNLSQELSSAQEFFQKAFSKVEAASISKILNNSSLPEDLIRITKDGVQDKEVPRAPSFPNISSILKPDSNSNNNSFSTRLIETPDGSRRVDLNPDD